MGSCTDPQLQNTNTRIVAASVHQSTSPGHKGGHRLIRRPRLHLVVRALALLALAALELVGGGLRERGFKGCALGRGVRSGARHLPDWSGSAVAGD